jgi:hypothetical protein
MIDEDFFSKGPYSLWLRITKDSPYKRAIIRRKEMHPNATLSQLRGHPRKGQRPLSKLSTNPVHRISYSNLTVREKEIRSRANEVLQLMRRKGYSLSRASNEVGITPNAVINNTGALRKVGSRWTVKKHDSLERTMVIFSNGRTYIITVKDSRHASLIGRYHNAVKMYRNTGDVSYLKPFKGKRVKDNDGMWHTLETDPKTIYDIQERTPNEEFIEIYNSEV